MGIPDSLTPRSTTDYILGLLSASEDTPYMGEPVSQLQHSLQCAALAAGASAHPPADEATQVAALLHDIAQFAPAEDLRAATGRAVSNHGGVQTADEGSVGRVGHDTIGAGFLLSLGFPPKVARLVGSHVEAKRYLCAAEPGYERRLSEASRKSLMYQGGPMGEAERDAFARQEWCADMCRLRRWDDEAKVRGLRVRDVESWRGPVERVLSGLDSSE